MLLPVLSFILNDMSCPEVFVKCKPGVYVTVCLFPMWRVSVVRLKVYESVRCDVTVMQLQ